MSSEDEGNARGGFRLFRIMTKLAQVKWQIVVTLFFAARFSMIFTKMVKGLVILYGGKMNSIKFWSISPSWEQKYQRLWPGISLSHQFRFQPCCVPVTSALCIPRRPLPATPPTAIWHPYRPLIGLHWSRMSACPPRPRPSAVCVRCRSALTQLQASCHKWWQHLRWDWRHVQSWLKSSKYLD